MAGLQIVRISNDEDVFAADETKVHTLSRRAISDMLESADRADTASSAPPPASGVREVEANRPAPSKSGMVPAIPRAAAVPVIAHDEDDSDLEPTTLHERAKPTSIPRQELVQRLMAAPPVIICPPSIPPSLPSAVALTPGGAPLLDRRMIAITLGAFIATVLPALALIHHLLQR